MTLSKSRTTLTCTLESRDDSGDVEVIRIPLAQSAILSFSYSQDRPIGLDQEGTVLSTHDLKDDEKTPKGERNETTVE